MQPPKFQITDRPWLGDETINSSLVERGRSLMDPRPHLLLHFLVRMRPASLFRSLKVWKSQGERFGLYGRCWSVSQPNLWRLSLTRLAVWGQALSCKRMILSDSIPGRFDFMARRSILSHQETNHTSLLFFLASISNAGRTHFTLRSPPEQQRNNYVSLCICTMHVSYPTDGSCQLVAKNVFYGGCSVFIWLPPYIKRILDDRN